VEQYNLLTEKWTDLKEAEVKDCYSVFITVVPVRTFIYGFGGESEMYHCPDTDTERILRLDT